ncbi:hypothetical protein HPULCUR_000654 [Helicostylum pulchrum]|uniref:Uncharacterized protein n=1 Tax=Helicostylum pulchrum TaxID=562976 RepID=A0ABP9XKH2_9FUNG
MNSFPSIKDAIDIITTAFLDIGTLKEHDILTREIITQCHEVYTTFYYQMREISEEYSKADERLDCIRLELLVADSIKVLNTRITDEVKDDTYYLLKILDKNKEKIKDIQKTAIKCKDKTESQKKDLDKNSPGKYTLKESGQTILNGGISGFATMAIAEEIISGNIALVTGPIPLIAVASLYTAVSRIFTYQVRNKKKSSLSKALDKILELLGNLLEQADKFNKLHTNTLKELNKYLRSIDNMVKRSFEEGPLSHLVLVDGMLRKTEKIKPIFEGITTLAETNAESLRKELLRINPRSIIDS